VGNLARNGPASSRIAANELSTRLNMYIVMNTAAGKSSGSVAKIWSASELEIYRKSTVSDPVRSQMVVMP
jgi:hypothetical protein